MRSRTHICMCRYMYAYIGRGYLNGYGSNSSCLRIRYSEIALDGLPQIHVAICANTLVAYQPFQRLTWICLHVLLNACFKLSSFSYLPCMRVASDGLYVGTPYVWSIDRTAKTTPYWHRIQSNVPRRFIDCKCTLM